MRFLCLALAAVIPVVNASLQVVPGGTWTTSNNEHLQAHGGGIIKVNSTYYLVGEDKTGGSAFQNVNCYSSTDLVQWTYVGALLSQGSSGDLGPNRVVERPKVLFNDKTGKYVMWMHIDSSNYGDAKTGVAVGDTVCGKYQYRTSFQPLGKQSRDMGLFKDDDGKGYLLTEDRQNGLRIVGLSDDYLTVTSNIYLWPDHIEAPALIKLNGRYYMFGSKLTGWDPNDNVVSSSTYLSSGWSSWATFADKGSNTYTSQTNYVLKTSDTSAIYLGDRWVSSNLMASTYVWLPLTFTGTGGVSMKNFVSWVPNILNGAPASSGWASPPAETSYEGETATYGGKARNVDCGGCSNKLAAGYIGGLDRGTVSFSGVRSDVDAVTTVRIKYMNGDNKTRYANVRVNGDTGRKVAFLPNGADPSSSTLHVPLKSGSGNTVVIEGVGDGWGPDVDRLMVPVQ
ncbi:glycoside hydrolase family 43 protein [Pseudomassariella vexata]|uniref:Glycoside hydrolase family 43 protein n=1 Tax=Pseudomassariella vexata TaxID=1141098 RepID=A0A1Y2DHX7_9PEZI|nr:glycoside hydrolase family 43 protein [Pseudomassariella vexata]ORY58734.1 glycoside hydrolase family 43 protein [Pseudomassariella vexata]